MTKKQEVRVSELRKRVAARSLTLTQAIKELKTLGLKPSELGIMEGSLIPRRSDSFPPVHRRPLSLEDYDRMPSTPYWKRG